MVNNANNENEEDYIA